jgi:hypothetical protein
MPENKLSVNQNKNNNTTIEVVGSFLRSSKFYTRHRLGVKELG